jgi:hypothetical protein
MNRVKIYLVNGGFIELGLVDDYDIDFTDLDSIAEYFDYEGNPSDIVKVEMFDELGGG